MEEPEFLDAGQTPAIAWLGGQIPASEDLLRLRQAQPPLLLLALDPFVDAGSETRELKQVVR